MAQSNPFSNSTSLHSSDKADASLSTQVTTSSLSSPALHPPSSTLLNPRGGSDRPSPNLLNATTVTYEVSMPYRRCSQPYLKTTDHPFTAISAHSTQPIHPTDSDGKESVKVNSSSRPPDGESCLTQPNSLNSPLITMSDPCDAHSGVGQSEGCTCGGDVMCPRAIKFSANIVEPSSAPLDETLEAAPPLTLAWTTSDGGATWVWGTGCGDRHVVRSPRVPSEINQIGQTGSGLAVADVDHFKVVAPQQDVPTEARLFSDTSNLDNIRDICINKIEEWLHVDKKSVMVSQILSGLTNQLFKVSLEDKALSLVSTTAPTQVLFRIYGKTTAEFYDGPFERSVYEMLSDYRIAPRLIAEFQDGRIEEFLQATPLNFEIQCLPPVMASVAAILAKFHSLHLTEESFPSVELMPRHSSILRYLDRWQKASARFYAMQKVDHTVFPTSVFDDMTREASEIKNYISCTQLEKEYTGMVGDEKAKKVYEAVRQYLRRSRQHKKSPASADGPQSHEALALLHEGYRYGVLVGSCRVFSHNDCRPDNVLVMNSSSASATPPTVSPSLPAPTPHSATNLESRSDLVANDSIESGDKDDGLGADSPTWIRKASYPSHFFRLIDFEYSDFGEAAFDTANMFNETMIDYSTTEAPFFLWRREMAPSKSMRELFVSVYLSQFFHELILVETHKGLIEGFLAAVDRQMILSNLIWSFWSIIRATQPSTGDFDCGAYGIIRFRMAMHIKEQLVKRGVLGGWGLPFCERGEGDGK
eukprot:GHVN01081215.1.p1 GENE.GHVN01081215.1~~GHVN01081215.1.p1  ORF type:complete len:790 (+),score=142.17 GHVN01081215.1:99-2372(+)